MYYHLFSTYGLGLCKQFWLHIFYGGNWVQRQLLEYLHYSYLFRYKVRTIKSDIGMIVTYSDQYYFYHTAGWLAKKVSVLRLKMANKTDERIRLMNEIISGIQVIKMYMWEKHFQKLIDDARK